MRRMPTVALLAVIIILPSYISLNVGTVRASNLSPHNAILIDNGAGFTADNGVTGGSGSASDPYIIEGWEISSPSSYAIRVQGAWSNGPLGTNPHVVIRNVLIHDSHPPTCVPTVGGCDWTSEAAVALVGTSNVVLENMTIRNTRIAIGVESSLNVTISRNMLQSNSAAVSIDGSGNIAVVDNNIADNVAGVGVVYCMCSGSNDIFISDNIVEGNSNVGIDGFRCECVITGNTILNNHEGIFLNGAPAAFHNNFINNTIQAGGGCERELCHRIWDDGYPSGGNYWSDLVSIDNCSGPNQDVCPSPDGIADHPRVVVGDCLGPCDGLDRYPLMKPFAPIVSGNVRFKPSSMSTESGPDYLVAFITLSKAYRITDLVLSSIRLNDTIAPILDPPASHCNTDVSSSKLCQERVVLAVRFNSTQVNALLSRSGNYVLKVTGNLLTSTDFRPFEASAIVHLSLSRNTSEHRKDMDDREATVQRLRPLSDARQNGDDSAGTPGRAAGRPSKEDAPPVRHEVTSHQAHAPAHRRNEIKIYEAVERSV